MLKFATIESVATMTQDTFYYKPRSYQTIKRWKNVSSEEWQNPLWQDRNTIRDVESLSEIIKLTEYQKSDIQRTLVIH